MTVEALRHYLKDQQTGPLEAEGELETLLFRAWDEIEGSGDGGMQSRKLLGRIEDATWSSPVLSFRIERHGATVNGSVYAEIQMWEIDCEKGVASYDQFKSGRRQVGSKKSPLKVEPIAKEIAGFIASGSDDKGLNWISPKEARILISVIIPNNCCQQTLSGRRKRFYTALEAELATTGWVRKSPLSPTYVLASAEPES